MNKPTRTLNCVIIALVASLVILLGVTVIINLTQQRLGDEELLESGQIEVPEEYRYGDARDQIDYRIWHNQTTDDLILEVQTTSYSDAVGDRTVAHRPLTLPGQESNQGAYGTRRYGYLGKFSDYNSETSVYDITTGDGYCEIEFNTKSYNSSPKNYLLFNNYDAFFHNAPRTSSIRFG